MVMLKPHDSFKLYQLKDNPGTCRSLSLNGSSGRLILFKGSFILAKDDF